MLFYSCGACGLSMLSQMLPCFEHWMWLLIPAFLLYYVQNAVVEVEQIPIVRALCFVAVGFALSAAMLSFIILPLTFAGCILFYGWRALDYQNRFVKVTSLALLACFGLTGIWGYWEKRRLGRDYGLTRLQSGGPGSSFFMKMAAEPDFDAAHYLELLCRGTSREAYNVENILLVRQKHITSKANFLRELAIFEKGLSSCPEARLEQLKRVIGAYAADKPRWEESKETPQKSTGTATS
jgi:hypothetical protein